MTNRAKYATIKYKELMLFCLWLLTASWPPASSRIVLLSIWQLTKILTLDKLILIKCSICQNGRVLTRISKNFRNPVHYTLQGQLLVIFLAFFIKRYWRAVHYTLRATVFVNKWFFWPAPDGPLKCSPSVRSELKLTL